MNQRTILFAVVGVLLVTVVWWLFLFSPQRGKVGDLRNEVQSLNSQAQTLQAEKARLEAIEENLLTFEVNLAELERSIPPSPDLASFIEDVNLLAAQTSIDLISLAPSQPASTLNQPFSEIQISMVAEGQFFEILGFIYGLSDLDRLVRVDSLSLASTLQDDGTVLISASLTGRIFTFATAIPAVPETEEGAGDGGDGS